MVVAQHRSRRPTASALASQNKGGSQNRGRTVRRSGISPRTRQRVLRAMSTEDPTLALTTASHGLERVTTRLMSENRAPGAPVFSNQYENLVERSHAVSASDVVSLTCEVSVTFVEKNTGEMRGSGSYTQALEASVTGSNGLERDAHVTLDESEFEIDRGFTVDPDFDLAQRFPARGNPGEGFYAEIEVPVVASGDTTKRESSEPVRNTHERVTRTQTDGGEGVEREEISIIVNGGEIASSLSVLVPQDPRLRPSSLDQFARAWLAGRGITPLFINIDDHTVYVTAHSSSSWSAGAPQPPRVSKLSDYGLLTRGYVTPNDRDDLGSDEDDAAEQDMIASMSAEATRIAVSHLDDSRVKARAVRGSDEAQLGYLWSYYAAEKGKPRRRELRQLLHLMGTKYAMAYVQASQHATLDTPLSDVIDEMTLYLSRVVAKTEGLHDNTYLTLVVTPLSVDEASGVSLTVSAVLHYDA